MLVTLNSELLSKGLKCPPGKRRIEYVDRDGVPGLYVEVRATSEGEGTYYLRYKDVHGKTCHQRIGSTKEVTLADARKRAKLLKAEICLGADPRAAAKAKKLILTYSTFFKEHYLPYVKPRKRSWDRDEELFRLRIESVFGSKRLDQITRQQIQSFHTALAAEGLAAATANHHVKLLKHSLNLAVDWGMLESNPAKRIPMLHEDNKVERYMDDDELERLLDVLRTDDNRAVCSIAMLLLASGCRLNELLRARYADLDVGNRVLTIRATNSKSKKTRSVPLNDSALDVLASLNTESEFEYLFVNRDTGKPYVAIAKVWDRLRRKAGLPRLRLHDLRHQFASFLVNGGRTLYEVQQILGHSDAKVTQRYAHLSTKTLQEAANSASLRIEAGLKRAG
jgi:integrase